MIQLRGISWDHPRGHDPMVATAKAFMDAHPDVQITWDTRSLQAFADHPVERLAETYDLMVIDHPFVGFAAATACVLPLDQHLDAAFLADQAANSVGPSHRAYTYRDHHWALAIDAAAQVSAYRPDLLERAGQRLPRNWQEVLELAESLRDTETRVAVPLIPVDCIMCFCSLCASAGEPPFQHAERVVSRPVGRFALETLKALRDAGHPESLGWNPPRALDRMSATDEIVYMPLLFGYSNYARPGSRPRLVRFCGVPKGEDSVLRGGILGGAGLAISSQTRHAEIASRYAAFVSSSKMQRTLYVEAGGQPGHRDAWLDDAINAATSDFFRDTLPSLDAAYLRPRYHGFMSVQERGGELIHAFLTEDGDVAGTLAALDDAYCGSRQD